MSEEGEHNGGALGVDQLASMEPRFNERGRSAIGGEYTPRQDASMEPRFNERGRRASKCYVVSASRFNGASLQ